MTDLAYILAAIPQQPPFRFVDALTEVSDTHIAGHYTFDPTADFYKGHLPDYPVTPGVILIECMAQIALLGLGIHLAQQTEADTPMPFAFTSSEVQFLAPVFPGDKVEVQGEKVYFRLGKLKVKVRMTHQDGHAVARGTLAGVQSRSRL